MNFVAKVFVLIEVWVLGRLFVGVSCEQNNNVSLSEKATTPEVLYTDFKMAKLRTKLKDELTGKVKEIELKLEARMLKDANITLEELDGQPLEKVSKGVYNIRSRTSGLEIPINLELEQVITFNGINGLTFSISNTGFMSRTVKDLEDDPTLLLIPGAGLSWPLPPSQCVNVSSVSVLVSRHNVSISVGENKKTILNQSDVFESLPAGSLLKRGLLVLALHPCSGHVTFCQVFQTFDFGFYRALLWALGTIAPGRIVVQLALGDNASWQLGPALKALERNGSLWAKYFLHRDGWLKAFVSGGKVVSEVLVPNIMSPMRQAGVAPVQAQFSLPRMDQNRDSECYSKWGKNARWDARRSFCSLHDGFGALCDCEQPFDIPVKGKVDQNISIALLVQTSNRTRSIFRLIESVGTQPGVTREHFLISTDSEYPQEVYKLAFILDLKVLRHSSGSPNFVSRISNNLQFGLFHALKHFPNGKYFAVLEDDLVLAPDFYAYMSHLAPIFELDASIFCVSAFNHLSYPHTSGDPSLVYRVQTFPSYGWMMSRENVEYITPKFLPVKYPLDWDYFIGSPLISRSRETLVPDVNRSYHWSIGGVHNRGSLQGEEFYLARTLNNRTGLTFPPLESLMKTNYEKEFLRLIRKAKVLTVKKDMTNFTSPVQKGNVYKVFVRMKNDTDTLGFQLIGEMLGIWTLDARDHHKHAWRMSYRGATLFVVGTPMSPYRLPGVQYLSPVDETINMADHYTSVYSTAKRNTHSENKTLPDFFYSRPETESGVAGGSLTS